MFCIVFLLCWTLGAYFKSLKQMGNKKANVITDQLRTLMLYKVCAVQAVDLWHRLRVCSRGWEPTVEAEGVQ